MGLPPRVSAITLFCRDLGRTAAFYRQFGWPEAPTSVPEHVVFQCSNGVVLGLFSETIFEQQYGRPSVEFRGFTLTKHFEDEATVERAHREIAAFDDVCDLDAEPTRSGWGYGFGFRDPEGNTAPNSISAASSSIPDQAGAHLGVRVKSNVPRIARERRRGLGSNDTSG